MTKIHEMRPITFILFLIVSLNSFGQANSCNVMYDYKDVSIELALDRWKAWCKTEFVYDPKDLAKFRISGDHGYITLKKALDTAFEDSSLGWYQMDEESIKIIPKSKMSRYVSISNKFQGTSLNKVFNIWKFNYELDIKYDQEDVAGIEIYGNLKDATLEEALQKVLYNTPLDFKMFEERRIEIFKAKGKKEEQKLYTKISKNVTLSGKVKDDLTGETLPYANVVVQNSQIGTQSNVDGHFSLFGIPSDTSSLEISFLGYTSKSIKLNPDLVKSNIEIGLTPNNLIVDEITITATKKEQMMKASTGISRIGMSPAALSQLPSYGEKDIFRSLQLLPGISGSNESSSGLFVRGGTPDQNLVLFDGFTVYHVDHLFGFFSAFNTNAVKDVQLYKGCFDAKYGGRLSSVVELTGKDGNTKGFNMGVGLSLLSVNAFAEAPFANGKGSFLVAGRRSFQSSFYNNIFGAYTESNEAETNADQNPIVSRFGQQEVQPNTFFYDVNAKATYRPNDQDVFSISFYNGKDDLDNSRNIDQSAFANRFVNINFSFEQQSTDLTEWGNWGTSAKWSRKWGDRFYSNANLSYSNYFSRRDRTDNLTITRADTTITINTGSFEENDLKDISLKIDNEFKISQNNQLDFGLQSTWNNIDYNFTQNDSITILDRLDEGQTTTFYIQDKHTVGNRLILRGGLRTTHYSPTDQLYLEPRASFSFLITDKIKLKAAWGKYYQFANRIVREDIEQGSRDFWLLADDDSVPVSSALHHIAGLSYETEKWLFDIEGFYKNLDGLSEFSTRFTPQGIGLDRVLNFEEFFFTGTGIAKGIEVLAQRKVGKLTGWASYTIGEVKYDFEAFGDEPFFANQDVTHELKIVGNYKLGNFSLGTTFVYATGRPFTAPTGFFQVELLDGSTSEFFEVSDKNALRYDDYHKLDVSGTYDLNLGDSKASIGVSLTNIYNRQNTWFNEYDVIEGELLETNVSLLGFTPSLFFNWTLR